MSVFIQWNMRSMNSNKEELNILLSTYNPDVVCLQETQLKANTNIAFKHSLIFHRTVMSVAAQYMVVLLCW